MATKLYALSSLATISRGEQTTCESGSAKWWRAWALSTTAGSSSTVTYARNIPGTSDYEMTVFDSDWANQARLLEWISPPLAAAATISGTVTVQWYGYEDAMVHNMYGRCKIQKIAATDFALSDIITVSEATEFQDGSPSALQETGTPTSTSMAKGDRLRVVFATTGNNAADLFLYINDADATTSWVQFNENLTFTTSDPSTQTLYLTQTASDVATADVDYKTWTATS